jgi:hypothetical protein
LTWVNDFDGRASKLSGNRNKRLTVRRKHSASGCSNRSARVDFCPANLSSAALELLY